jgi:hypothetical protein
VIVLVGRSTSSADVYVIEPTEKTVPPPGVSK